MRLVLAALLILAAGPLRADDLFLPIVGKAVGHDGREYRTEVEIMAPRAADVTVSHLVASKPNPNPRKEMYRLAAAETRVLDAFDGFGALRLETTRDVRVEARFFSRKDGVQTAGGTMRAIHAREAIGNGEVARLSGTPAAGLRAKLYVVETSGYPIQFLATLLEADGTIQAEKFFYLSPREPRAYDLGAEFPGKHGDVLTLRGVNGDGRLVAAISYIDTATAAATMHEMLRVSKRRHRFSVAEIATYVTVAMGMFIAAAVRRDASRRPG